MCVIVYIIIIAIKVQTWISLYLFYITGCWLFGWTSRESWSSFPEKKSCHTPMVPQNLTWNKWIWRFWGVLCWILGWFSGWCFNWHCILAVNIELFFWVLALVERCIHGQSQQTRKKKEINRWRPCGATSQ